MSTDNNKTLLHRFFEEAFNTGNMQVVDDVLTEGYTDHDPVQPRPITSREAMKGFMTYLRNAIPDVRFVVEDVIADGDKVAYRWTASGTQQGEFFGAPPTGRRFTTTGTHLARVSDGKIAEVWTNWDTLGMLQQLGVIPTPETVGA